MSKSTGARIEAIGSSVVPTGRPGGGGTLDLRLRIPGPGSRHHGEIAVIDRSSGQLVESLMLSDFAHMPEVLARIVRDARDALREV